MTLAVVLPGMTASCGWFPGWSFTPGHYEGNVTCDLEVTNPTGDAGQAERVVPIDLVVTNAGTIIINNVEIAVGAEVVRSIETADLTFEVTSLLRVGDRLTVAYEPRPTLPGISIEGMLVEVYHQRSGSVRATAQSDLEITDAEGITTLSADCRGVLPRQVPP